MVRESYPDPTAYTKGDKYYDAKYTREENPSPWVSVDVMLVRKLHRPITLKKLKQSLSLNDTGASGKAPLSNMALFKQSRLSCQPVTKDEWEYILTLEWDEQARKIAKSRVGSRVIES